MEPIRTTWLTVIAHPLCISSVIHQFGAKEQYGLHPSIFFNFSIKGYRHRRPHNGFTVAMKLGSFLLL